MTTNNTFKLSWGYLIAFSLCELKLSPETFWNLSFRELNSILMAQYGNPLAKNMTRQDLNELIEKYPNE